MRTPPRSDLRPRSSAGLGRSPGATVRRRQARAVWLLLVALAGAALATMFVATSFWPAFALPIVAAFPLAGRGGLAVALVVAASVFAVVAG